MMELTIDGNVYNFNFGYGFMKELNPKVKQPVDGIPGKVEEIGMKYAVSSFHRVEILRLDISTWSGKRKHVPVAD